MRIARIESESGLVHARIAGAEAELFDGVPWEGGQPTGTRTTFNEAMLRAPVSPSKVVCIGRNYAAHARELGHDVPKAPLLFLKAPSAITSHGGVVVLPKESERVEHEAELAIVIGKRAKNVPAADALSHVFGYTAACDVTARDLQKSDGQWTRAKSFDTFCPIGPWIETELSPRALRVQCRVNGETRQDGSTEAMLFDVPAVIAYVSQMMTLEPGDLILTGTPEGVGPLASGDRLEVEIEGIGVLSLSVTTP